jgi:hypothetical protein
MPNPHVAAKSDPVSEFAVIARIFNPANPVSSHLSPIPVDRKMPPYLVPANNVFPSGPIARVVTGYGTFARKPIGVIGSHLISAGLRVVRIPKMSTTNNITTIPTNPRRSHCQARP